MGRLFKATLLVSAALGASPTDWLTVRKQLINTTMYAGGELPYDRMPDWMPEMNVTGVTQLVWNMSGPFFRMNATGYHWPHDPAGTTDPSKRSQVAMIWHDGHGLGNPGHLRNDVPPCTAPEEGCQCTATGCPGGCARCNATNSSDCYCDNRCQWWIVGGKSNNSFHEVAHRQWGMDLFWLFMPLRGPNWQDIILPDGSVYEPRPYGHDWFRQWQDKGDLTMRYFLGPTIYTINYALSLGYKAVWVTGVSGGGWTAMAAAAIDPRIPVSLPCADSLPWIFGAHAHGDYEQDLQRGNPDWFLSIANFTVLYLLGALEPGRVSMQMLHENDECCFHAATRHDAIAGYTRWIWEQLAALPEHGNHTTVVADESHHWFNANELTMVTWVHDQLLAHPATMPRFDRVPCDILWHGPDDVPCDSDTGAVAMPEASLLDF